MTGRIKAFRQNLLLLIASIIITAFLAEIALRLVLPAPIVWKYPQEQYHYDARVGHWLDSNQQTHTHDKLVLTNSAGIRDSEYTADPVPGVYRILALGDSQTFGNGLEIADTWPKQLETELNLGTEGKTIEVLNAGLPGSDTWQHEIILKRLLSTYKPDAIVLALYVNDIVERFTPHPRQHKNDKPLIKKLGYLLKQSVLLLSLQKAMGTLKQWQSPKEGAANYNTLLKGETSPDLAKRWKQVDISLATMKEESEKNNSIFSIALLPRRDQVSGQLPWEGYSNRLKNIAQRHHIPIASTLEPLQNAYKTYGKELFIPWDGHNSKIANQVIAREIGNKLIVVGTKK